MTTIAGTVALVTGANRGIGLAFVQELRRCGASHVLAGMRDPDLLPAGLRAAGVQAVQLDVTDPEQVAAAAAAHGNVSIVINNAGYHAGSRLILTDSGHDARQEMEVNYFGVLSMTRAFAPVLAANDGGAFVNVLSVAGMVPAPFMGGYSPAKAAALWLSTIARAELAPAGTQVTALIVGSVDTRMSGHVQGEKAAPADIARVGCEALERGEHVVDTDAMAVDARARMARDPARFERSLAKLLDVTALRIQP